MHVEQVELELEALEAKAELLDEIEAETTSNDITEHYEQVRLF